MIVTALEDTKDIDFTLQQGFSILGQIWNIHESDGSFRSYIDISIGDEFTGTLPGDIDTIKVTGPSGTTVASYPDDDFDYAPQWKSFSIAIPGSPELGEYTFTVVSGILTGTATDFQSIVRTIPIPDTSTFSPADGATLTSKTPTFSWHPIDYDEATIFYRLVISDLEGNWVFFTGRQQGMLSCTAPLGLLNPGQTYRWLVEAHDSSSYNTLQNRSQSDWLTFTMDSTLTHSATPAIDLDGWGTVTWSTTYGTDLLCSVRVIDHDGVSSDGSSHSVIVAFPNGDTYTPNFDYSVSSTSADYYVYVDLQGNHPQSGDYTFTVTDLIRMRMWARL